MYHNDPADKSLVAQALDADTPDDGLLLHLKLLAADAIPDGLMDGTPDPEPIAGYKVGGVVLEMNCPPLLAIEVLRRTADAIERDAVLEAMRN